MTPDNIIFNEVISTEDENMEKIVTSQTKPRRYEIVYLNVLSFIYYHLAGLYGLYLCFTAVTWPTIFYNYINFLLSGLGITAGVHRLWSHRSYKAKMPLQIFLMLCHSLANQQTVVHWVRDHRLHHKYSDTDADPHNASRGFFFSHIGWLMVKKHPEAKKRCMLIDISDIHSNPVLTFQKRNAIWLITTAAFIIPTLIPMYFWSETFSNAWHANLFRFCLNLHITCLVNSVAHMWGYKPYDKNIAPTQSLPIIFLTLGEGYHNYHHVFPWDYRTGELGNNKWNFFTRFIDICARLGLAYDRRYPSDDVIKAKANRTGDGSDLWCTKRCVTKTLESENICR